MSHVCPWWIIFTFDNPLRKRIHRPERLFGAYVRPGSRVLDIGCGAGFNTVGLARLVGPSGHITAVDVQRKMLDMTEERLRRHGLMDRVRLVEASSDSLNLGTQAPFDFANAFWMLHEVPNQKHLFGQLGLLLAQEGCLLVCEPKVHVPKRAFDRSLVVATQTGWTMHEGPSVAFSRSVVLKRRQPALCANDDSHER